MKIKTVIIDDNYYEIENAKMIIENNDLNISIIGEASSVLDGVKLINKKKPELAILDIELPDGSAFDLLDCFPKYNFNVIFITAFSHYAVKAFKFSALAFIEKPINSDELKSAIQKIENNTLEVNSYKNLLYNMNLESPLKLEIRTSEGFYYIDIKNIIHFHSEGRYSTIYLFDGRKIVVAKNIGDYESLLSERGFVRTHLSHLVNLRYVEKFLYKEGWQINMSDGTIIKVSRKKKDLFQKEMKKYTY